MAKKQSAAMTAHRGIELALEQTPPEQWRVSPLLTKALISCPRAKRMASNALRRYGVSKDCLEEVVQDVSLTMQTKILVNGLGEARGQLKDIGDVYFVIYKVVDLTVRNYQKKPKLAASNMVSNFSDVQFENESYEDMMGRFTGDEVDEGGFDRIHQKIDAQNSRIRLQAKIAQFGWPEHIERVRSVLGRPTKQ